GKFLRVPGIVTISYRPSAGRFNPKTALKKFHDLAAPYTVEEVGGTFRWRDVPNLGSPGWAQLRAELERLEAERRELDAAMLSSDDWLRKEGERTDDLACLHDRSEEHTSELQSRVDIVCRLLLEKKKSVN